MVYTTVLACRCRVSWILLSSLIVCCRRLIGIWSELQIRRARAVGVFKSASTTSDYFASNVLFNCIACSTVRFVRVDRGFFFAGTFVGGGVGISSEFQHLRALRAVSTRFMIPRITFARMCGNKTCGVACTTVLACRCGVSADIDFLADCMLPTADWHFV